MTLGLSMVVCMYVVLGLAGLFANALAPSFSPPGATPAGALFRHPVSARLCASENRLQRLESALAELCAAVLQADDIGLLEQHSAGMGPIYQDGSFNMSRGPLMLRAAVRDVMLRYELPARPVQRKWLSGNHSQAAGGARHFF